MSRTTRSDIAHRRSRRQARPILEGLEDRMLLYSTTGGNWVHDSRITFSFAPDGTSIGGTPSAWFQRMTDLGYSESSWKDQIRRAASVWEQVADLDLAEVGDNGATIGTGAQQGDPNFGDIRIGGYDQASGILATAFYPPPHNGGGLAGDIFFNTDPSWQINGTTYDLQTVAIHEFGHALGMGHSAISAAVMYAGYTGTKQALNSDDTGGIQFIYGTRPADAFDANGTNQTYSTADNITSYLDGSGRLALSGLDISTTTDIDWYKVTVPAGTTGTMTVRMQSGGSSSINELSSQSPKVSVYSTSTTHLGTSSSSQYGDVVTVTITGVTAGQEYRIRAMGQNTGPSAVGSYALLVNFGSGAQSLVDAPNTYVAAQADQGGGSSQGRSDNRHKGGGSDEVEIISIGNLSGYGHSLEIGGHPHDDLDHGHPVLTEATDLDFFLFDGADQDQQDQTPSARQRGRSRATVSAVDAVLDHWRP